MIARWIYVYTLKWGKIGDEKHHMNSYFCPYFWSSETYCKIAKYRSTIIIKNNMLDVLIISFLEWSFDYSIFLNCCRWFSIEKEWQYRNESYIHLQILLHFFLYSTSAYIAQNCEIRHFCLTCF